MTSLEKTNGEDAPLIRDIYAHIETWDIDFLRTELDYGLWVSIKSCSQSRTITLGK